MNDKELSLRTLIDAKVLMYTSDDALDKTTAAIYDWHTRKLKEAVVAAETSLDWKWSKELERKVREARIDEFNYFTDNYIHLFAGREHDKEHRALQEHFFEIAKEQTDER